MIASRHVGRWLARLLGAGLVYRFFAQAVTRIGLNIGHSVRGGVRDNRARDRQGTGESRGYSVCVSRRLERCNTVGSNHCKGRHPGFSGESPWGIGFRSLPFPLHRRFRSRAIRDSYLRNGRVCCSVLLSRGQLVHGLATSKGTRPGRSPRIWIASHPAVAKPNTALDRPGMSGVVMPVRRVRRPRLHRRDVRLLCGTFPLYSEVRRRA